MLAELVSYLFIVEFPKLLVFGLSGRTKKVDV
jgi:hypothetical protein